MRPPSMRSKLKSTKATSADHVYAYAAVEGRPPALPGSGMPDGAPPQIVSLSGGISLVVSRVPAQMYNAESIEARLSDLDWVSHAGAAHHTIVEAVADAGFVVLPFRLFTIFSSEASAREALVERLTAIQRAFDRVRGRSEWVLRIGKPDPSRVTQPANVEATSGTSFLASKAKARRDEAARTARVQHDAAAAYEALAKLADAARLKDVEPGGTVLIDAALLVPSDAAEALERALTAAAGQLLDDGCAVSLTGPWPPYSFASLDGPAHG